MISNFLRTLRTTRSLGLTFCGVLLLLYDSQAQVVEHTPIAFVSRTLETGFVMANAGDSSIAAASNAYASLKPNGAGSGGAFEYFEADFGVSVTIESVMFFAYDIGIDE